MLSLAKRCLGPAALAIAYVAMAVIAFSIHDHERFVMLMWAPIGIALGAMLRWGIRLWPGVAIGAFVGVVVNGFSPFPALWIAAIDTLEVVSAVLALRALGFRSTLTRVRDVFALLGVTIPLALIGATVSTTGVYAMGYLPMPLPEALSTWWFSHVPAFLIIAPIILTVGRPRAHRRRRIVERTALLGGLFIVSAQTFGVLPPWLFGIDDVYVLMPFVVWAAVRFGPRGTSLANFVLAAMAVHSWTVGFGPFENVADAQIFISTETISSLILAAYAIERARLTKRKTAIFSAAFDAIITMDDECRLVELNPAAERLFGLTMRDAGVPIPEHMIPHELCDPTRAGLRTRYNAQRLDGTTFAAEISLTRMSLAGEEVIAAFVRDVTAEYQTQQVLEAKVHARTAQLAHRGMMLRRAEELAHLGSFEADLATGRVEWSDELYRIYGRDPATFAPTFDSFLASVYEADRERIRAAIDEALDTRQPFRFEERIMRPDGSIRVLISKGQAFVENGHVRIAGCCQDVTERSEVEAARDRLVKMVESSADAIVTLGLDGTIESWNVGASRIFGYAPEEVIGKSFKILLPAQDADDFAHSLAIVKSGGAVAHYERIHQRHDGSTFPALVTMSVVTDSANRVIAISKMLRDISERKRAEDELRMSLHEKDVLLREIHHRVKNNLQVISSLLNLQLVDEPAAPVRKSLAESQSRIQSMALVHRLLYQSKDLARIDFGEYLRRLNDTLYEAYNVWPERIAMHVSASRIRLDIDRAIPCGLIVNEVVTNALTHAFPDDRRGNIWIDARQGDGEVELVIRDDGVGIPLEIDIGKVRSFGLQIARTLSQQLDGNITLERNGGTTVRVTFPYELPESNVQVYDRDRVQRSAAPLQSGS